MAKASSGLAPRRIGTTTVEKSPLLFLTSITLAPLIAALASLTDYVAPITRSVSK